MVLASPLTDWIITVGHRKVKLVTHRKPNLPKKTCAVCGRPFNWRKKWERDWENVRYCSERCKKKSSDRASSLCVRKEKEESDLGFVNWDINKSF